MNRRRIDPTAERALIGVRAPNEPGAEERAWTTVKAAYLERPRSTPARRRRPLAAVPLVAACLAAVALSPAGATVTRIINRAFSPPHIARMTGLSLPAPGRVLVSSARGTWIVSAGGSVRRLGSQVQITLPASIEPGAWTQTLQGELEKLGYREEGE